MVLDFLQSAIIWLFQAIMVIVLFGMALFGIVCTLWMLYSMVLG